MAKDLFLDQGMGMLGAALSGLARRQELIAGNVANMDTPGFRPSDVPFEQVLDRQMRGEKPLSLSLTSSGHIPGDDQGSVQIGDMRSALIYKDDGNGIDVDAEMARLSETAIQFNAVSQLLAARIGLMRSAITEGRR